MKIDVDLDRIDTRRIDSSFRVSIASMIPDDLELEAGETVEVAFLGGVRDD